LLDKTAKGVEWRAKSEEGAGMGTHRMRSGKKTAFRALDIT
jgi:hypothetical protein